MASIVVQQGLTAGGGVSAASQAEQETATEAAKYVAPATQQYHPSAAKAWFKSTGSSSQTLQVNYNITSLSDDGSGLVGVTIATDFSSVNYAVCATLQVRNAAGAGVAGVTGTTANLPTVGAFQLLLSDGNNTPNDLSSTGTTPGIHCVMFGDQA